MAPIRQIIRTILILIFSMNLVQAADTPPQVVVTLKPIYGLTSQIMAGVAKPTLLLPDYASPHTFQMRPSQHQALQSADLIIWMDPNLENFMVKPLATVKPQFGQLTLSQLPTLTRHPQRMDKNWESTCPCHGHDHGHNHDHGHDHHHGIEASTDPHLWLSPHNAIIMATAIAQRLEKADPAHAKQYEENLQVLIARLEDLDHDLKQQLQPVKTTPFLVYHDGYQYFEKDYKLNAKGTLVLNPHVPLSAKRLHELHHLIKEKHIKCVFTETEFKENKVAKILKNPNVKVVELDPLGAKVPADTNTYDNILKNLANDFSGCLAQPNTTPKNKSAPNH